MSYKLLQLLGTAAVTFGVSTEADISARTVSAQSVSIGAGLGAGLSW